MLYIFLSCTVLVQSFNECRTNHECVDYFGEGSICQSDGYCSDISQDDDMDGYTGLEGDCNDEDASIYPGAVDILNDKIDQDCTGYDATWLGQSCEKLPEKTSVLEIHHIMPDMTFTDQYFNEFNLYSICDSIALIRIFNMDSIHPNSLQQLEEYWQSYRVNGYFSLAVVMDGTEPASTETLLGLASDYNLSYPLLSANIDQFETLNAVESDKYILLDRGSSVLYLNVNPPSSNFIESWF